MNGGASKVVKVKVLRVLKVAASRAVTVKGGPLGSEERGPPEKKGGPQGSEGEGLRGS